ncbi:MAG: hypothetical protein QXR87_07735 [Candidatus Hadarchaeales archaeon]
MDFVNRLIDSPGSVDEFSKFIAETPNWLPEWKKTVPNLRPDREEFLIGLAKEFDKESTNYEIKKYFLQIEHDAGRSREPRGGSIYAGLPAFTQLKFLSKKGSDYIKAWYLHHLMDYVASSAITDVKEIIERIKERTGVPDFTRPEFEEVKLFFEKNYDAIVLDIEKYLREKEDAKKPRFEKVPVDSRKTSIITCDSCQKKIERGESGSGQKLFYCPKQERTIGEGARPLPECLEVGEDGKKRIKM